MLFESMLLVFLLIVHVHHGLVVSLCSIGSWTLRVFKVRHHLSPRSLGNIPVNIRFPAVMLSFQSWLCEYR